MQQTYENVHPNLVVDLLFVRTKVECGKDLLVVVAAVTDQASLFK